MIDLMLVAVAKCDDKKCYHCVESFSLPLSQALTFADTSRDFFVARGWRFEKVGKKERVFCPDCAARRVSK